MRAYLITATLLVVIFGSIGSYVYWQFSIAASADHSTPPVTVAAAMSRLESRDRYLDAVGTIRAIHGVELTSETSGEITELYFDSGDIVASGQRLAVLNDTVEQASRQNQIASVELAKLLYERDAKLIGQKSIPQSQYDRSLADLQRARAQLAETEARLAQKRITAPFSGTTGIRRVEIGDYVTPGTVITSLQDLSELEIDFSVPSQAAPALRPGLRIEVRVAAYAAQTFNASLFAVDSRVDSSTRNIAVRAKIDTGSNLVPGMFATLRLALEQQHQVVTVPETAVTYSLHGNTVYVIKPGQDGRGLTADPVVVSVGEVDGGRIAILSGLAPEERVVTAGQNKLYRSALISVDESVRL